MADKLVFIFTGKINASASYTEYSESNLRTLTQANGFIVALSGNYAANGAGSGGRYTTLINNNIKPLVQNIKKVNKSFYIGIPPVNAPSNYSSTQRSADYTRLKQYVKDIKSMLQTSDVNAWSLFKGFYWTNERIMGTISASNITAEQHAKLLNDMAYLIRSDTGTGILKEFIWAPYMGFNSTYYTINQNIGLIANKTSIFNKVFLQSGWYWTNPVYRDEHPGMWDAKTRTGIPEGNLKLVKDSVTQNVFKNWPANYSEANMNSITVTGVNVGGTKTGSTIIGLDMEAEDDLGKNPDNHPEYQETRRFFDPLVGNYPIVFYAGSWNGVIQSGVYNKINEFYGQR